jgi:predicted dehydrogenase
MKNQGKIFHIFHLHNFLVRKMSKTKGESVLLVGAGYMAKEYSKVLKAKQIPLIIVGRGKISAKNFEEETNLEVELGGIKNWLKNNNIFPQYAIVSTTGTELGNTTRSLINSGFKKILLEKPGGLNNEDIKSIAESAKKHNANVLIGYNRRFFASVIKAKDIINEDGGVSSFTFEFTEWSHVIENLEKDDEIKNRWLLHNSTHVIDLAFYLGGEPKELKSYISGSLNWHPSGAIFIGSGLTKNNTLFSYHSNWDAPGRWSVEILTKKHRLIFRPLEKLHIQQKNSVAIEEVDIDDRLDLEFKPGLYKQVEAFLNDDYNEFIDIQGQLKRLKYYDIISKGNIL